MLEATVDQVRRFVLQKQGLRTNRPLKSVVEVASRIHNIQIVTCVEHTTTKMQDVLRTVNF